MTTLVICNFWLVVHAAQWFHVCAVQGRGTALLAPGAFYTRGEAPGTACPVMALHASRCEDKQLRSPNGLVASPCVLPFAAEESSASWTASSTGSASAWSPFLLAPAASVVTMARTATSPCVSLSFQEHVDGQCHSFEDCDLQCAANPCQTAVRASALDLWSVCQGQRPTPATSAASSSTVAHERHAVQHGGPTACASKATVAEAAPSWRQCREEAVRWSPVPAVGTDKVTMDEVPASMVDNESRSHGGPCSHEAQPCGGLGATLAAGSPSGCEHRPRRRLTRKQCVLSPEVAAPGAGACPDAPAWKLRKKAAQHYAQEQMKEQAVEGATYHDRRAVLCREFKSLPPAVQAAWCAKAATATQATADEAQPAADAPDAQPAVPKVGDGREKVCAALLTWNGSWLQQDPLVASLFAQYGSSTQTLSRVLAAAAPLRALFH